MLGIVKLTRTIIIKSQFIHNGTDSWIHPDKHKNNSLIDDGFNDSYLNANKAEIHKFKGLDNIHVHLVCLGIIKLRKLYLMLLFMIFAIDYGVICTIDILNIHEY